MMCISLLCRTRESLASNTSSIVESNRRQNPALSPGHIGTSSIGLPFSFRAIPEPPTTQPEKLQKSSNCLASITSVWQAAQTETTEMGKVVEDRGTGIWMSEWVSEWGVSRLPSLPSTHTHTHTHTSSDSWESIYWDCYRKTGMASRDCSHSFKNLTAKKRRKYQDSFFPPLQDHCRLRNLPEVLWFWWHGF